MIRKQRWVPMAAALLSAAMLIGVRQAGAQQGKGKGKAAVPQQEARGPAEPNLGAVQIRALKAQGNVWMLYGPRTNMAVQTGPAGVLIVDTMYAQTVPAVLAEIRKLSDKAIRYVINTSADLHHVGGNQGLNRAGQPIVGGNLGQAAFNRGAAMVAHENVLTRMSAPSGKIPPFPEGWWPMTTYFEGNKEIHFNGEAVILMQHKGHSNGDSVVHFRGSDVVATGDVFNTYTYPVIDLAAGGSVNGEIAALNQILDIAIPEHEQEGGTQIIPGFGRLAEEHDVLEYRDMVTIVRDRVGAMIGKNMTLEQVQASNPTKEYDPRWGAKTGPWTTAQFVEAVYRSLKK